MFGWSLPEPFTLLHGNEWHLCRPAQQTQQGEGCPLSSQRTQKVDLPQSARFSFSSPLSYSSIPIAASVAKLQHGSYAES